jgi:hypothetical protein
MSEQLESNIYFRYYADGVIGKIEAADAQAKAMFETLNRYETKPNGQFAERINLIKAVTESPEWVKLIASINQK